MNVKLTNKHKIKVKESDDIFKVMKHVLLRDNKIDREKEHFWLVCMASNNLIATIELVSLGSVDATMVKPMNVFRVAVLKGAVKVILCHNHPSGELQPSEADEDVTDRLIQVGRILNIEVTDHLIISTKTYISFADTGLLQKLQESTKWVPPYAIIERIRKEEKKLRAQAIAIEKEKSAKKIESVKNKAAIEKEKALIKKEKEKEKEKEIAVKQEREKAERNLIAEKQAIAKSMKEDGDPIEKIVRITGLTEKEIKKL